jgi:hypothetical protein
MNKVFLRTSTNPNKKLMVTILYTDEGKKKIKTVHVGTKGYSDFTKHKDNKRKELYLARHKKREKWGKDGILSSGFWARWLLWNRATLEDSIKHIEEKFNLKIYQ